MNNKTTYVLFGTLLAFLAVIAVVQLTDDSAPGDGFLLAALQREKIKPENIDTLEIEYGLPATEKLVFVRENETRWKMTEPKTARVESILVNDIVRELLGARTESGGDLTSNLALHGLDKPTVKVTIKRGSDISESVQLGNVSLGGDSGFVYLLTSEKPGVPQAVKRSALRALFKRIDEQNAPKTSDAIAYVKNATDFRTLRLLSAEMPQAFDEAQSISLSQGKAELVLQRGSGGDWRFDKPAGFGNADPDGGPPTVDQSITGVRPLISNIVNLRAIGTEDVIDDLRDLAALGLNSDNPDLLKITLKRKPIGGDQTISETLLIGKDVDAAGGKVYAMLEGDTVAMKVPGGAGIKALRLVVQDPKGLRDRNLLRIAAANVDALQMVVGADTIDLYRVGSPALWNLFDSAGAAQNGNQAAVDALLTALTEPRKISNFPAAGQTDAALGFDKPQGELKLWVDGIIKPESKDEKKDDKPALTKPNLKPEPTARLVFGKSEGDFIYVRRILGKDTLDAMVPESLFSLIKRKRVEYLEPKLSTFQANDATKLKIERKATDGKSAVNFAAERQNKDNASPATSVWKLVLPDSLKDRNADPVKINAMLANLVTMKPQKLIADKPSVDALASWGLAADNPVMKATVELKEVTDGSKERVFLFGNLTEDKSAYYAKQANGDLVFTVSRLIVETLGDSDIMDMVIYRIDRAKVKKLKLSGWADIVGSVQVREVERKGESWAFVGNVAYEIDSRKVDNFLEDLLAPRAEKFVVFKSGPTPEYGLDLNKGALEIELTVEGFEKPITLMLGKGDTIKIERGNDPNPTPLPIYYAQSNQSPGDVFTLLQDRFKAVRTIAAVFRKE